MKTACRVKGVVGTVDKIIPQAEYFEKCGSKYNWAGCNSFNI